MHDRLRVNKRRKNPFLNQVLLLNKLVVKYNIEGIFDLPPADAWYLNFWLESPEIWHRGWSDLGQRPFGDLGEGCQLEPADYQ